TANRSNTRKPPNDVTSAKLDAIHSRLLSLETKVDSKSGFPQAVVVDVASAGIRKAAVQIGIPFDRPPLLLPTPN
ncbi:hypothetical protein PHJA_001713700, partial [Phtheirospermum japonicum]